MPETQLDIDMKDAARDVANRTERMLNLWMRHAALADKWYAALEQIVHQSTTLEQAQAIAKSAL